MTHINNSPQAQRHETSFHRVVTSFTSLLGNAASAISNSLSALRVNAQMARMISVLFDMSDHELDQIGISRSDIFDYAEKLVAPETKGLKRAV